MIPDEKFWGGIMVTTTFKDVTFEHLGHASMRLEATDGVVVYIDPWTRVVDGEPRDADVVFITHDDFDHYDPECIEAVSNDETEILVQRGIDTSELGRDVALLDTHDEFEVENIHIRTVPAYNRREGKHVRPSGNPYHPEGTVIGLVLEIGETTLYYCSDTDALEENYSIQADVVIPPIGGGPTMDRYEAAELVRHISPALVIPVHYELELVDGMGADGEAFKTEVESMGIAVALS